MGETILVNRVLKLCVLFVSLLLFMSLTMSSMYADSGSSGDKIDMTMEMVRTHMETMRQKFPGIHEKVQQTEERLKAGVVSPKDACSNCHTKGRQ